MALLFIRKKIDEVQLRITLTNYRKRRSATKVLYKHSVGLSVSVIIGISHHKHQTYRLPVVEIQAHIQYVRGYRR